MPSARGDLHEVFGKQLVNLATNHFNFWMPFAFDYASRRSWASSSTAR